MGDSLDNARSASLGGADLGSQALRISDEGTTVCPFPRSWYPADSPCSQTDDTVTGAEQRPWVAPEDKARLQATWGDLTSLGSKLKVLGWIVLGVTATYLAVRGLEAYATISKR